METHESSKKGLELRAVSFREVVQQFIELFWPFETLNTSLSSSHRIFSLVFCFVSDVLLNLQWKESYYISGGGFVCRDEADLFRLIQPITKPNRLTIMSVCMSWTKMIIMMMMIMTGFLFPTGGVCMSWPKIITSGYFLDFCNGVGNRPTQTKAGQSKLVGLWQKQNCVWTFSISAILTHCDIVLKKSKSEQIGWMNYEGKLGLDEKMSSPLP